MSMYDDLVSCKFDGCTPDDLNGIESRASDAVDDLMLGVSAIGSLMFWAAGSDGCPAELEAEAMLSCEQAYPDDFTLADRTAERMTRARNGLAHVMTDLLPLLEVEQAAIAYCWLSKVLTIVDIARIDAEGSA